MLKTAVGTFSGVTLSENSNFGDYDYAFTPKTAEESAMLEMVATLNDRRSLFLQAEEATSPKNEEAVGNFESYTLPVD